MARCMEVGLPGIVRFCDLITDSLGALYSNVLLGRKITWTKR